MENRTNVSRPRLKLLASLLQYIIMGHNGTLGKEIDFSSPSNPIIFTIKRSVISCTQHTCLTYMGLVIRMLHKCYMFLEKRKKIFLLVDTVVVGELKFDICRILENFYLNTCNPLKKKAKFAKYETYSMNTYMHDQSCYHKDYL